MSEHGAAHRYCYVDSDQALEQVCQELVQCPHLAFDSEFIRTDTFFPKPGLYQLDNGSSTYLVDPVVIDDWSGFKQLLSNHRIEVVMHSCGEDLGLLRHALDILPAQLFDTQRAASFVGYDYSLSYQALVGAELGVEVPKGETRSDWLRRPLAQSQLAYAALDVAYLLELRSRLLEKLASLGRLTWFEADCRNMIASVSDEWDRTAWESAYRNIGSAWQLNQDSLLVLQKLAYWRESKARERDRPRNWIAKDQELLTLAGRLPAQGTASQRDIEQAEVFSPRFLARNARSIVEFLNSENTFQQQAEPDMLSRPLNNRARRQLKELQKLTREVAEKLAISPELLARKRLWIEMLENCQRGVQEFWPAGLDNWRRELLEQGAVKILFGSGA
jgi:ribonuclease D